MERIDTMLRGIEDALHVLACAALVLIAVLINADIVGRVLFRAPLQLQFELVEFYLMPMVATLSLARVFREGGHLALELLDPGAFPRVWPSLRVAMLVASMLFVGALTVMSARFAFDAFRGGDVYFGVYDWPLGWAYLCVPLGCTVLCARLLLTLQGRGDPLISAHQ